MTEENTTSHVMPVYSYRLPVRFTRGKGIWLWDDTDPKAAYLDALSGRGVCNLGHSHPLLTQRLQTQAACLLHTSNLYRIPQQEKLAEVLCQRFSMTQAFFANSGAETIEAALKIALIYGQQKSISNPIIITLQGSYHGRSLGALALSDTPYLRHEKKVIGLNTPFTILSIPINDVITLEKTIEQYSSRIIAILFEPIQGDGGIYPCSFEFLQQIKKHCRQNDYLMIADEIQTGLCRTGTWLNCEQRKVHPDILVLAKSLGNGIPIGAYLVNKKLKDLLKGYHGSTFAGNPLACEAALTVLQILEQDNLAKKAANQGHYLKERLQEKYSHYPIVKAIRGQGLMLGIELDHPCQAIMKIALQNKLLIDIVGTTTIRLLPPLILATDEAEELIKRLDNTFHDYLLNYQSFN